MSEEMLFVEEFAGWYGGILEPGTVEIQLEQVEAPARSSPDLAFFHTLPVAGHLTLQHRQGLMACALSLQPDAKEGCPSARERGSELNLRPILARHRHPQIHTASLRGTRGLALGIKPKRIRLVDESLLRKGL